MRRRSHYRQVLAFACVLVAGLAHATAPAAQGSVRATVPPMVAALAKGFAQSLPATLATQEREGERQSFESNFLQGLLNMTYQGEPRTDSGNSMGFQAGQRHYAEHPEQLESLLRDYGFTRVLHVTGEYELLNKESRFHRVPLFRPENRAMSSWALMSLRHRGFPHDLVGKCSRLGLNGYLSPDIDSSYLPFKLRTLHYLDVECAEDLQREAQCAQTPPAERHSATTPHAFDAAEQVSQHASLLAEPNYNNSVRKAVSLLERLLRNGLGKSSKSLTAILGEFALAPDFLHARNYSARTYHQGGRSIKVGESAPTLASNLLRPVMPSAVAFSGGDGSTVDKAVTIFGTDQSPVVAAAEAAWLAKRYPRYDLQFQTIEVVADGRTFDVARIMTRDCKLRTIRFDVTRVLGKRRE